MRSEITTETPIGSRAVPTAPLLLGLAGLIPFAGLVAGIALSPVFGLTAAQCAAALAGYGAVILSFLGGIRWGLATAAPDRTTAGQFGLAVMPSLIAWGALALPTREALVVLGLVVLLLGPLDGRLVRAGLAQAWFARLRLILSGGAGVALLAGAAIVTLRA